MLNNSVFEKAMENIRKHIDFKFVKIEGRGNYMASKPTYRNL